MKTSAITITDNKVDQIKECFKRLRLPGATERFMELLVNPQDNQMTTVDCLVDIFTAEVNRRNSNALNRRLREAKIVLPNATAANIDYSVERGINKNQMASLLTLKWMEDQQNVIITGAAGCGKTFIACTLVTQACLQGKTARVLRVPLLLSQMSASRLITDAYFKQLRELKGVDLLVLDDWGIGQLDAKSRADLLEIINERHLFASTIITSVLPVDKWASYINDATYADAILDRLVSNCHRIELSGPSMRQKKNRKAS
jgi:DNA replication protein DnaC